MLEARRTREAMAGDDLFGRIGAFLVRHRLSPEPGHYAFAFHVCSEADGPLAQAVATLTDDGVRLSGEDIAALGGEVSTGLPPLQGADEFDQQADRLIADTQRQVDGFADMVSTIHDETRGFGRDLAASADALSLSRDLSALDEIARVTGAMLERVRAAEQRLEAATREAGELRGKLAEAQGSARRDPLTELPNRRALEEAFAGREGRAMHLALCDVDHFKRINDTFGHAVGDRVLTAIGQTLAKRCGGHLVARFGGEEFAVLIDGLGGHEARTLLDDVRASISDRRFRLRESELPIGQITLSIGLAALSESETLEAALARADAALYRAKGQGRDRVCQAPD